MTLTKPDDVLTMLPCPFCGSEPRVSTYKTESLWSHDQVTYTKVECPECEIAFNSEPGYEVEAPAAWNRRASDGSSGMVKGLLIAYGDARVAAANGSRETWSADSARMDAAFAAVLSAIQPVSGDRWSPPAPEDREDGYQCLIWHRGRWRHVSWSATQRGWMFGYASAHCMDAAGRLYAPLPSHTPEHVFWDGEKS